MDPLSISFGIAGVLPLIAKVITTAHQYVKAVAGAEKMITALIMELELLQSAVTKLEDILTSQGLADADVKFDQTSVLLSCTAAIEIKLQELFRKLVHDSSRKMGRFLWPLTEKEHQKTIAELRNFSTWIQFALSVDGCRLLAQTSETVLAVVAQQLQQFDALRRLDAKTTELVGAVQKHTRVLEDGAKLEERNKVLDWLSTAKYDAKHVLLRRSRAKNTGIWLVRSERFTQWRDGLVGLGVLWCNGIQGSGKTTLACTAIDELRCGFATPETPLAYFYFDQQDHQSQAPLAVVSSLLRQLIEQLPELPTSVTELYQLRSKLHGREIAEYERLLLEVVRTCKAAYIVIDALDECENTKYLLQLIDKLSHIDTSRLLVTSRPHIHEGLPSSRPYPAIRIEAHEDDIRRYVLEQCDDANICKIADQQFVDQLVEKLVQRASGMFLLPVLQLRTVLNEPTIGEMEDKLEQLTDTLSDAFDDTFSRIQRLPESRRRLATSALMHLAHAKRLFNVAELSDILALKPDSTSINPKYRPTATMILDCCQGLAMLDEQTGQLRLAHYAIQEYLVSNSENLFPQFAVQLASECLDYMMLNDFNTGPLDSKEAINERLEAYPFLSYASANWGRYVKPVEANPDVWSKLLAFYRSLPASAVSTQIKYYLKGYHKGYYCVDESISTRPLHHAATNCLESSTKALLNHFNVNEATAMGTTPIIKAASSGHVAIVKLLLEHGADPRIRNYYGDALQCAAEAGRCETIRQLVQWGMDPNGDSNYRSPLSCALDNDCANSVELLADLGADLRLNEYDEHVNTFLEACDLDCKRTVDLMLQRGWVDVLSGSPDLIVHALLTSNWPMIRHLISAGADVNAVDRHGRTFLRHAREGGIEAEVVHILYNENTTLDGVIQSMDIDAASQDMSDGSQNCSGVLMGEATYHQPLPTRSLKDI